MTDRALTLTIVCDSGTAPRCAAVCDFARRDLDRPAWLDRLP
jgi:hypothetical protein